MPNIMSVAGALTLRSGSAHIVMSDNEPGPLKLAVESLCRDFQKALPCLQHITEFSKHGMTMTPFLI